MPTLTNVVEFVVKGSSPLQGGGAKNIFNVFHYRLNSGTMDAKSALVTPFNTLLQAAIEGCLSVDYTATVLSIRYLDNALDQYFDATVSYAGTQTGDRLPADMALVYLLRTSTRGKNFRGSKHFGPLAESSTTKDEIASTFMTPPTTLKTALGDPFVGTTGSYVPVVVSRTLSQLRTNPTTIIGDAIAQVLLNKTIGTMRRRREKTVR